MRADVKQGKGSPRGLYGAALSCPPFLGFVAVGPQKPAKEGAGLSFIWISTRHCPSISTERFRISSFRRDVGMEDLAEQRSVRGSNYLNPAEYHREGSV